jgi:hypothetical protein
MKQKSTLILDNEFIQYCELNKVENIDKLAKETFNRGFTILKYGETPFGKQQVKEIIKEVEKVVEVIKEVPVEKIIEVIKEVPVEVIKEVVVEAKGKTKVVTKEVIKEVKIKDTEEIRKLTQENESLKNELEQIKNSLSKFNNARFMKSSNLSSLYDE